MQHECLLFERKQHDDDVPNKQHARLLSISRFPFAHCIQHPHDASATKQAQQTTI